MIKSKVSEEINRLLPGEDHKRIRAAILVAARAGSATARTLTTEIQQENINSQGLLNEGTLNFSNSTTAVLDLFAWGIGSTIFQPGETTVPVIPPDANYPRVDYFHGDNTGNILYSPGTIDAEGNSQFPDIPQGNILLRTVIRNTDGTNTDQPIAPNNSDFVSKSTENPQSLKSDLVFEKQAGFPRNYATFTQNGQLQTSRADFAGVYSTLEGIGGHSLILTINLKLPEQQNYSATLEFSGVSTLYEKGIIWVQFMVDANSGDILTNSLQLFGEFTLDKYKLIKVNPTTYALYVAHDGPNDFYKYRPLFNFGGSTVYQYHHLSPKTDPLPAGDQYGFAIFPEAAGVSTGAGPGLSLDTEGNIQLGETFEGMEYQFVDINQFPSQAIAFQTANHYINNQGGMNLHMGLNINSYPQSQIFFVQTYNANYEKWSTLNISPESFSLKHQQAEIIVGHYNAYQNLTVVDGEFLKGLGDAADYSANKTDFSYITKKMLTDAIAASGGGGEGGSSKWTDIVEGIYRNSKVLIGAAAFTDPGAKLEVFGRISQVGLGASTYFGFEAGKSDDLSGNYNTGFGYNALKATVGNTFGYQNTAIGAFALYQNISGYDNVAIGVNSMAANTTGYMNMAQGTAALAANTTGFWNTAVGQAALQNNTTGSRNTAIGIQAGLFNTTGLYNTYIGGIAAQNTNGSSNVIVGYNTAQGRTVANNSVLIGSFSNTSGNSQTNSIVIGYNTVGEGSNTVAIGNANITKNRFYGTMQHADAVQDNESVTLGQVNTLISQNLDALLKSFSGYNAATSQYFTHDASGNFVWVDI